MKRFLLTGLMILGLGQFATYAQQRGTYQDDIYYNSKDAKKEAEAQKQKAAAAQEARRQRQEQERANDENTYSSSGNATDANGDEGSMAYKRSYETDADGDGYRDDNDELFYSSRVRRFGYSYWGPGYYSPFYDPFWYDPWYGRSGVTVSIGWGWGPSWGYGYPYGYGWGYPYYGWGYPYGYGWGYPYGGYGYGCGGYAYGGGYCGPGYGYGGYYGGYGYGNYHKVNYGPRTSLGSNSNGRRAGSAGVPQSTTGPIRQQKMSQPDDTRGVMRSRELPDQPISNQNGTAVEGRSRRFEQNQPAQQQPVQEQRMQRSRIFGGQSGQTGQAGDSRPRYEQRQGSQPVERQRYQQPAPSYERSGSSPRSTPMGSPGGGGMGGGRRR